jgi:FkbM family methyltransferase
MEIKVGRDLSLFPSLIRGDFEHDELQMVSGLKLDSGVSIWDVGANIGVYSIFFAKTFKNVKIVSFEPSKSTFGLLKENLFHNKCDQVSLFNCGLGKSTESQFLIKSDLGAGSNSIVLQEGPLSNTREKIEMTTIDIFISNFPDLAPKLIKIDVEGYEPQVIMGGAVFIEFQKPIIMMEVFPLLWNKNAYADWQVCLDFLFTTYGEALELRSNDSRVIRSFNFERNQNQRTLFFGLNNDS